MDSVMCIITCYDVSVVSAWRCVYALWWQVLAGQLRPVSITMMNLVASVLNKLLVAGVTDDGMCVLQRWKKRKRSSRQEKFWI